MTVAKHYAAVTSLEEATTGAARTGVAILAGGTDLLPRWSKGNLDRPPFVLDVKAIGELRGIVEVDGEIRVGACATMAELRTDPIIARGAPLLAEAAGRIACPQIRNRATLGGNLCNASPAADSAVPLILLDAVVEIAAAGPSGPTTRKVVITDFFQGPGATTLAPGEVLTRVCFEPIPKGWRWGWDKFGTRPAMEIAVASVGVLLGFDGQTVVHARVGYGSVAPTPLRGALAEAALTGQVLSDDVIGACTQAARDEISPITDLRASAEYRREVVAVMLRRMLTDARPA